MDLITLFILVVAFLVVLFLVLQSRGRLLRKVGPNQALIVSGAGGTRAFTDGWHVVIPLYQHTQIISLGLMTFDVVTSQDLSTTQEVALTVEAVTQMKVRADEESIKTAVQHFLSKRQEERVNLIRQIMESHLRDIVGQLTVEDILKDPENVGSKMLKTVTPDMEKMGLEVLSFTLKDVRDKNGYITNMGRAMVAEIRKKADIATAQSLNNLASLYKTQGKYEQAEPLYVRALSIHEQQLGPQHPSTASSLNNLAWLYDAQGKYEQAKPLYQRALAIREQQLGPEHPDTATSLNNLAGLYRAQGKYGQAEPLLVRALSICEQRLGTAHPRTQIIRGNYLSLLRATGRDEEATRLERKHTSSS